MLARKLISDMFFLSGIVSRDFETVAGSQVTDGLDILNDIIAEKSTNAIGIPYSSHIDLPLIKGQESYFIDGLVETQVVTFTLNNVVYKMYPATRQQYFNNSKPLDTQSLPYHYYAERELNGTRLYFYFIPTDNLTANITGRFSFSEAELDTELRDVFDRFYISYLKYEGAYRLCNFFGYPFSPENEKVREKLERKTNKVTGVDTTLRKVSPFRARSSLTYAQINIGRGFTPPR